MMVQELLGTTVAPFVQVLEPESEKSEAFAPVKVTAELRTRFPVPVFSINTVSGADALPTT
jgi:hypothetical protein